MKDKIILAIIFIILIAASIFWLFPYFTDYITAAFGGKKDCGYNYECFIDFARKGLPVFMKMNRTIWEENATFYIENKGIEGDKTRIYVRLDNASGYLREIEGSEMDCVIGNESEIDLSSLGSKVCSICSGSLIENLTTIKKDCKSDLNCFLKSALIGRPSYVILSQSILTEELSAYFEIRNTPEKKCEAAAQLYVEVEKTPTLLNSFSGMNMTCSIENADITDFKPESCSGSLVDNTIFSLVKALMQNR